MYKMILYMHFKFLREKKIPKMLDNIGQNWYLLLLKIGRPSILNIKCNVMFLFKLANIDLTFFAIPLYLILIPVKLLFI